MRNKVNFDTANKSFGEIISNSKKYKVPKYQRDYSWDQEQWDDLWQDIVDIHKSAEKEREEHYMGYLVLQKHAIDEFTVIDGQQRLTTLSIIILAALQILNRSGNESDNNKSDNKSDNEKRLEIIRGRYVSTKSAGSLLENYKLELNRNNDEYYRNELANLTDKPRQRNIKNTERLMVKAKQFYEKAIDNLKFNGEQLGEFIENIISNYLLFTVITVGDDVNAYKVFETLNARGVQLSTPDLLKNYLFSIIDPSYSQIKLIEQYEEKWSITLHNLGGEDFPRFLRTFWNSRNPLVTKTKLFKNIKRQINKDKEASEMLESIKQSSEVYAALRNPEDELWRSITNENNKQLIKECVQVLRTFNIVQPYTILLSAYERLDKKGFARICKYLTSFCIRYHAICNKPAKEVEAFYNKLAIAIHKREMDVFSAKEELKAKVPNDEEFENAFASKTMPTAQSVKKVRYLLIKLEKHINPNSNIELSNSTLTIEHVLPKKGSKNDDYWRSQFGDSLEQNTQRLGNLTLLKESHNRSARANNFKQKKEVYCKSKLEIVKKLMKYKDWNIESLNAYQKFMANKATQIWKLD